MRSIRTQILILTLAAILVSILAIGIVCIVSVRQEGIANAQSDMVMLCDNHRKTLNQYFSSVEQSVNTASRFATDTLDSVELFTAGVIGVDGSLDALEGRNWNSARQVGFDLYMQDYLDGVNAVFQSIANHTTSVITYYFRVNPEVSMDSGGFFYVKEDGQTIFEKQILTDVIGFAKDDIQHVGWYYQALERGRPSWLSPYYNANIRVEMSSYVTPIYRAGTFIGVLGMDISYKTLVSQIKDIQIYDTGYAFLVDQDANFVFHPELANDENVDDYDSEFAQQLRSISAAGDQNMEPVLLDTVYNGVTKQAACVLLSNGLTLVVVAPFSEINSEWHQLVNKIVFITIGIIVLFTILTIILVRRLTQPLRQLTAAAESLMKEDYDVNLDYTGNNEVGVLTRSIKKLTDHLRVYVMDLNSLAYKDEMTGVKNKRAFDIYLQEINEEIRSAGEHGSVPELAAVVFDCNDLKVVNDVYGHWKGDDYLKNASWMICHVFASSPVFRTGGDEFCAVLKNADFVGREELIEQFRQQMKERNEVKEQLWEQVHVACGMAVFNPDTDPDFRETVHRADEKMYNNKHDMKSADAAATGRDPDARIERAYLKGKDQTGGE